MPAAMVRVSLGEDNLIRLISTSRKGKSYTTVLHPDEARQVASLLRQASEAAAVVKAGGGIA